jgi:hypothetical protein
MPACAILFIALLLFSLSHSGAVESTGFESFPKELIESDVKSLEEQVTYRGTPAILTNLQSDETTPGAALLVARTPLKEVDPEKLIRLSEYVASSVNAGALKLTTLSDVNATSQEAKRGAATPGQLLDFNENQTAVNAAAARGLGLVLFVDLLHFNSKASTVPGAGKLNILNARASLTLLNAADGFRELLVAVQRGDGGERLFQGKSAVGREVFENGGFVAGAGAAASAKDERAICGGLADL